MRWDPGAVAAGAVEFQQVIELVDEIMEDAGYRRVKREDIESCVGVASQWAVPLHVDLAMFEHLVVYARGDIIGTRFRRRLRSLYRLEAVEVPVYQRMTVVFQLKTEVHGEENLDTKTVHLRMFKNIPKARHRYSVARCPRPNFGYGSRQNHRAQSGWFPDFAS